MSACDDDLDQAARLLTDEANCLSLMASDYAWFKDMPHRAKCAIQREVSRLQGLATTLRSLMAHDANGVESVTELLVQAAEGLLDDDGVDRKAAEALASRIVTKLKNKK